MSGQGKTHRARLWTYCTTRYNQTKAAVFDSAEDRAGQSAERPIRFSALRWAGPQAMTVVPWGRSSATRSSW